jgi:hypothetical protein
MVYGDHTKSGFTTDEFLQRLKREGVIASGRPPTQVRFVTHRHYDAQAIEEALRRIGRAVGGRR